MSTFKDALIELDNEIADIITSYPDKAKIELSYLRAMRKNIGRIVALTKKHEQMRQQQPKQKSRSR